MRMPLKLSVAIAVVLNAGYFARPAHAQSQRQIVKVLTMKIADNKGFQVRMKLKEAIALLHQKVLAKTKIKLKFTIDEAAFKAQNPDAPTIQDTEILFPRMRNVYVMTILNVALSQCVVPATFRIQNGSVVIFPGKLPPLKDLRQTSLLTKSLIRKMSWPKTTKMKLREAIEFLGARGKFTILVSSHFRMENPDRPNVEDQTITIAAMKSTTYWQFISQMSNQIGGVPVVQNDHVMIATKNQLRPGGRPLRPVPLP